MSWLPHLRRTMLLASAFCFSTLPLLAAKGPQPTICERSCWSARSTSCSGTISSLTRAIIHHTAGSEYGSTGLESSKSYMRATQNYHMDNRGYCDIAYHFLVDKYGNIFEGRRNSMTGMPQGAHDGYNYNSFGFTAMGWFHPDKPGGGDIPTTALTTSLYDVIAWRMPSTWSPYGSGTYNGNTVGVLDGHRKVKATACPGDYLWPVIGTDYNGGAARTGVYERKNAPNAPTGLQAVATSTSQINLSWTDNSTVETQFKIERGNSSVGPWTPIATVNANVKNYSNTSLSINTVYYYRVQATGPLGDSAYSNIANATTMGPGPTISQQPQNQTKDPGQNVTFTVTATGTGTLTYQWKRNGTNLTNVGRISGALSSSLTISAVEATDVGTYFVNVTDSAGTTKSAEAQLFLNAIVIFQETFESGNLNNWTTLPSPATPLTISSTNHTAGGSKSAQLNSSYDKMYRNFLPEIEGRARATFWMYDNMGSQNRWYAEVRSYGGEGYNNGGLSQLFAIGRYGVGFGTGTGTLASEVVNPARYQARVVTGANTGWFNLNTERTAGWHKFEIERASNGTTLNFYVDGVLDRTITGATYATWDNVVLGSLGIAHTEVVADSWFDDVKLEYFSVPSITTHPTGLVRGVGGSATFTVGATNNVEGYQWLFEGVAISGATNPSYTRSSLQEEDSGTYSVIVKNRAGTVVSSNALLQVLIPPSIVDQPEDTSAQPGETASFTVAAAGSNPLHYQWFFNGTGLAGKTESTLTLSDVSTNQAGNYWVIVTNTAGTITSQVAQLTILNTVDSQFGSVAFTNGTLQFTFLGKAGTEYAIQASTNLVLWENITNVTYGEMSSEFQETVTNRPSRFYRAIQVE